MTGDSEVEFIDGANNCGRPQNHNAQSEIRALVEVTFPKNPTKKEKYLEAEPKALGLTQIMLSLFCMSTMLILFNVVHWVELQHIIAGGLSSFGLIAGSMAIAAQNLHLPKLKACLGVQIVMCVASGICLFRNTGIVVFSQSFPLCNEGFSHHKDSFNTELCIAWMNAYSHLAGVQMLMQAAQVAISATLAAFCCKVIQCCSPQTSVPVIVVNTPAAPE